MQVIVVSTDYRDYRKSAYQEYVVALDFNLVRMPARLSDEDGATLGVAFVTAALALGLCLGVDFNDAAGGPDLLRLVRGAAADDASNDNSIDGANMAGGYAASGQMEASDRPRPGDWLAIWGGRWTRGSPRERPRREEAPDRLCPRSASPASPPPRRSQARQHRPTWRRSWPSSRAFASPSSSTRPSTAPG